MYKMEFIEKLVESKDSLKMKDLHEQGVIFGFGNYEDNGFRMYEGINIGGVTLSIQASYGHYCSPRLTLPKEDYNSMELAIIKNDFVSADKVIDEDDLIEALAHYYNGTIYGYVPVILLEELYQELKNNEKE